MLFDDQPTEKILGDGWVRYYPRFLNSEEAAEFQTYLQEKTPWREEEIKLFGKMVMQPRLTALMGDDGMEYGYSGITMQPTPWSEETLAVKKKIESVCEEVFNVCLLNYYRHGQDSMGWHADDERELGRNPLIASLSLGDTRKFMLRNKADKKEKMTFLLEHGSLLLMGGDLQHRWQHQVPKTKHAQARINLTFRRVIR